ncbi:MAG: prepilin-type N-terminal cleavage/methylation domain-containing protein [Patescibacteria group bacterium]|jgi:Tfp pilus assembly protein FimT
MHFLNCQSKHQPSGFTIVELVVTLAILIVITLGVVMQVRRLSPSQALENGSDVVRAELILARTKAFTGQSCCGGIMPTAYGISITLGSSTVQQIADTTTLSTTILQDNVIVLSCEQNGDVSTTGDCIIKFNTSSDHSVLYNGGLDPNTIILTVREPKSMTVSTIKVYPAVAVIE